MKISYNTYKDMVLRIIQFENERGRKPNYVTVNGVKITKKQYEDMARRVDAFIKNKGRNPIAVSVQSKSTILPPVLRGPNWSKLENALNIRVNNAYDLYNAIAKKGKYSYYYNDIYNNSVARERLSKGIGINCTDYAQLLRPVLEEMGYKVRYTHGKVKCGSEWYGHVWLQIIGREFKNWINYDIVAVTHKGTKRPIGSLCCIGGVKDIEFNPSWLK